MGRTSSTCGRPSVGRGRVSSEGPGRIQPRSASGQVSWDPRARPREPHPTRPVRAPVPDQPRIHQVLRRMPCHQRPTHPRGRTSDAPARGDAQGHGETLRAAHDQALHSTVAAMLRRGGVLPVLPSHHRLIVQHPYMSPVLWVHGPEWAIQYRCLRIWPNGVRHRVPKPIPGLRWWLSERNQQASGAANPIVLAFIHDWARVATPRPRSNDGG